MHIKYISEPLGGNEFFNIISRKNEFNILNRHSHFIELHGNLSSNWVVVRIASPPKSWEIDIEVEVLLLSP